LWQILAMLTRNVCLIRLTISCLRVFTINTFARHPPTSRGRLIPFTETVISLINADVNQLKKASMAGSAFGLDLTIYTNFYGQRGSGLSLLNSASQGMGLIVRMSLTIWRMGARARARRSTHVSQRV
jgi:hypothetical protein